MATFSKEILSGSTDGRAVAVAATATPGTLVHTGSSTATTIDEIWLYAMNQSAADVKLTIEWGGATTGDLIEQTITTEGGLTLVAPGIIIKGNAGTALEVRAFAPVGINIFGYVNRIAV